MWICFPKPKTSTTADQQDNPSQHVSGKPLRAKQYHLLPLPSTPLLTRGFSGGWPVGQGTAGARGTCQPARPGPVPLKARGDRCSAAGCTGACLDPPSPACRPPGQTQPTPLLSISLTSVPERSNRPRWRGGPPHRLPPVAASYAEGPLCCAIKMVRQTSLERLEEGREKIYLGML